MRSAADTRQQPTQQRNPPGKSLTYTAYEGNSWQTTFHQSGQMQHLFSDELFACIETFAPITGVTVLVDPWLEGDLVFANQTWLYRGSKGALNDVKLDLDAIGSQADVILLSQVRGADKIQSHAQAFGGISSFCTPLSLRHICTAYLCCTA